MEERRRPRRQILIPRPPKAKTMAEFIVEVFVVVIATIMVGSIAGMFLLVILRPETDVGPYVNAITDVMTTIIGALIGYIAGKGAQKKEGE